MLRVFLASVLLAVSLSAQIVAPKPLSVTGVVELVPSPLSSILCAPPEYRLACSGGVFFIQSGSVDLSALLGQNVKLVATQIDPACPLFEVTSVVSPPPVFLELCGTPAVGCPVRLRSGPGGISQHLLWASGSPGLFPFSVKRGSLLLGMPFFALASGVGGGVEGLAFEFVLPSDPTLVGLPLWVQNARRDVGPITGPFILGNAVCFSILPGAVPCVMPDC
ncbi:MAG: hypothetical protein DRQ55_04625 [Planctomycetota bacterium]|nr:MAG: hypothetical protein DRQ55_04625 [Planctomycetota bacterium]